MVPDVTTVIIPAYNCEKYIDHCIRSVVSQTLNKLEILVIDDGSTDGTAEKLAEWSKKDSRVTVIHQENHGVASARNKGLELAAGEFLTFVDSDDYLDVHYLERMHDRMLHENAEIIIAGLTYVKPDGSVIRTIVPDAYERFEKEEWTFRISCTAAHYYRRSLWERYHVRFTGGERGEDMPIALFFSAVCDKIGVLSDAGYFYVQHESSAMHQFRGLKTFSLPYRSLSRAVRMTAKTGVVNGQDFYELFVLRILATCYYDLSRGADAKAQKKLCRYIAKVMAEYIPGYKHNMRTRLIGNRTEVPFAQKAAVWLLCRLAERRLLYVFARAFLR